MLVFDETQRLPNVLGDTLGLYADPKHPSIKGHGLIADLLAGAFAS